jgi:site-specific recombinase XerD
VIKPTKLWRTTSEECSLVLYAHSDGPVKRPYPGVRVLFWPDGKPCWPANMYLASTIRSGRSIGTSNTYAAELALFLRFLYQEKNQLDNVANDDIYRFSERLVAEPHPRIPQSGRRGGTQVNKILRRALTFLRWYQKLHPLSPLLVGEQGSGARITVEERVVRHKNRMIRYLWHDSMVSESVPADIKPMARNVFLALLAACRRLAKSRYVQARAATILKLLSDSGARRSEIASLRVSVVLEVVREKGTKLLLRTAKRGDWKVREVPMPPSTLDAIVSFIEVDRKLHVRRLRNAKKISHDPGWLFLTQDGKKLAVESITQDFARLRRIAGVSGRATAHMLRHRWITIQVLERLKAYIGKRLPMDMATSILTHVASMTGHRRIESLWSYVDLAFQEMGIWDTAETVINMRMNAEAAHRELTEIRERHSDGSPLTREELGRVDKLLHDLLTHVKPEFVEAAARKIDLRMALDTHSFRGNLHEGSRN